MVTFAFMKHLKSLFDFYLESSIHVSLAVCAFTFWSFLEFEIPVDWTLLGYVFFGTITGYNFVKYAPVAGLHHRSLARNLKAIQLFSLGSFLVLLYFVFQQSQKILSTSFLLGVLTILYSIPFMKSKSLRTLPGVKIFIVALVWAGVTVLFPWFTGEEQLAGEVWLPFVQRILWVVVLTLPFEIRDLAYDLPALGTIPQKLGVRKAKLLGVLFLVAILLLEGFKDTVSMAGILALFFAMALSGAFLLAAKKDQIMYYASFWVEATPLISLAVFLIINDYLSIS